MTGNFRFSEKYFPANGKPPDAYYSWVKPRQRAWWDASNKRKKPGNGANGEDHAADPESLSLADEIKAAKRTHRLGAGEQPQDGQIPPYGVAEYASAKHDSKSDKEAFLRLSKLSRADYDRVRIREAKALGIRPPTLDKEVNALRPRAEDEAQGSDLVLYAPEPWAYPVDGAELLDEIVTTIRTYLVVTVEQARTVALWAVASHAFMAFRIFPRLLIKGPNSECGKSTLKEVVAALVNKALLIDNASTAFIFRVIEQSKPTLLIDEGDTFIKNDEERR
jgi:hypothetical protein